MVMAGTTLAGALKWSNCSELPLLLALYNISHLPVLLVPSVSDVVNRSSLKVNSFVSLELQYLKFTTQS